MSAHDILKLELETRYGTTATWAQHILDALEGARYAVVELPRPNCCLEDLEAFASAVWIDLTLGDECVSVVDDEVAFTANAGYYSPAEARAMAAALLAAADAADASGTPVEASPQEQP